MRSSWQPRSAGPAALARIRRPLATASGVLIVCATLSTACQPRRGGPEPTTPEGASVPASEPTPEQTPPRADTWEQDRARAQVRVIVNDPARVGEALDRVASVYGSSTGERDGIITRLRELSLELGIPGPLIDGVDRHGSARVETVYPWLPPTDGEAGPGSALAIVIPSADPRSLAETTAALNLMRAARAESSRWEPSAQSLLPIYLRESSARVELSSSRAGLEDARALAERARDGQGLWLELDALSDIAPELTRALGYSLHDPTRARALKVAERLDRASASLEIQDGRDLVATLRVEGRFAELGGELDGVAELLGPTRTTPAPLERALPAAPVAAAVISLADPAIVQGWLTELVEAPGERPVFDAELRELGRGLNELIDQFVDDVALGIYAYGAGEHAFVLAATVRDPAAVRASVRGLVTTSADLMGRYSGFFNTLTGAKTSEQLNVKTRTARSGSIRAQHVAITLPPTLVPEERGSYVTFGRAGVFEYSAYVVDDTVYMTLGPGASRFRDAVAELARARGKDRAPAGSLAASPGSALVHAAPGGCQVCVVFDSAATARSLIGRAGYNMSEETIKEAERALPKLGVSGQGGWAGRFETRAASLRGYWPAAARERTAAEAAAWVRFLQLVGRAKGAAAGWSWPLG